MDNEILNSLNDGEHIAEITEYELHGETVYKLTVYECSVSGLWFKKKRVTPYEYPFFFETKEIIQRFLEKWGMFTVYQGTYWDTHDIKCYKIEIKNSHESTHYYMIDSYKYQRTDSYDHRCQLTNNGVWGGKISIDGHYYTYSRTIREFEKILDLEDVGICKNKTTYYKMTKV